jgi:Tfp pilus assembly protein PilN
MTTCNINLIATRRAQKQRAITLMRFAVYSLIALFVGVALLYAWMTVATRLTAGRVNEIEAKLADPTLTEAVGRIRFLETSIADLEPRLALLEKVHSSEEAWIRILRDVAKCIPGQVWVTQMTSRHGEREQTIALRGSAFAQRDIGEFMLRLDETDWSGSPQLGYTQADAGSRGQGAIEFEVTVPLKQIIGSDLR